MARRAADPRDSPKARRATVHAGSTTLRDGPRRRAGAAFRASLPFAAVTSPTPQSERRRAARALASFPVKLSSQPDAEPAVLRDISEIGLACSAPHAIAEMTLVGLDFSLPGATERHHVKGAVVRCEPVKPLVGSKKRWDIAVYFTEITPITRAALKHYVAKGKRAP